MAGYKIELEIAEGKGGSRQEQELTGAAPSFFKQGICGWMYRGDGCQSYRQGQRFAYPEESGRLCVWLLASLLPFIQVLRYGGTLPWTYEGTPYEKVIDPDGVTTEFVRCPDPSASGIVVKIIRTRLAD